MTPETLEQIATVTGVVLTLMIFSYLLGDNFLYRIAIHVFIGATAGFVLVTAVESVLIPWINLTILATPLEWPRLSVGLIPFMIGILLLLKASRQFSRLGDVGLMIMLGIGTALALWGALSGTLLPLAAQTIRSFRPENAINGFIVVVGTVSVLVYFTYLGVRRGSGVIEQRLPVRVTGLLGQAFIMIALGATYALLIISALTVLTGVVAERLLRLWAGG